MLRVRKTVVCKLIMSICIRRSSALNFDVSVGWRHWNLCKSSLLSSNARIIVVFIITKPPRQDSECRVVKCYELNDDAEHPTREQFFIAHAVVFPLLTQ